LAERKIIFIHGWATDGHVWEGVAEGISAICGGEAVVENLPGHGGAGRWTEPTLEPAIATVLGAAEGASSPVVGVGWSLGAQALMGAALREPERFHSLVLIGATPSFVRKGDFPSGQSPALVRRMIMDMKKDPGDALARFYRLNFTEEEMAMPEAKEFLDYYRWPGPVVCGDGVTSPPGCRPAFRYDEITTALEAIYRTDLRDVLDELECPVLLVHGSRDGVTPAGAAHFLAERIKDAKLEEIPGAGHAPFITERERFLRLVSDFFKR